MDRSEVLTLVSATYAADEIGQCVPTETTRTVFCNVRSVSRAEFFAGGEAGLRPSYVAAVFRYDYEGEQVAELDGVRYSIYRTYVRQDELVELYLEPRKGTEKPAPTPTPPTPVTT